MSWSLHSILFCDTDPLVVLRAKPRLVNPNIQLSSFTIAMTRQSLCAKALMLTISYEGARSYIPYEEKVASTLTE